MDWLRIGAFGLLILYHIGMVFVPWGYHVKTAEPVGAGDEFIGGGTLADVAGYRDRSGAGRGDLVEHIGAVQCRGHVVDDHGCTGTGQTDGFRTAESGGRARHHRDPAGEVGQFRHGANTSSLRASVRRAGSRRSPGGLPPLYRRESDPR